MNDADKAKAIFKRLFETTAQDPGPESPSYFVPRAMFHQECRKAGIPVPENFIQATEWEESIGLPEYVHRLVARYHKSRGSDFTPMEKGAWKLRKKLQ